MGRAKRVIFSFDKRSHQDLQQATEAGPFDSLAQTTREALSLLRTVQRIKDQGYVELVARNPETGAEVRLNNDELTV